MHVRCVVHVVPSDRTKISFQGHFRYVVVFSGDVTTP